MINTKNPPKISIIIVSFNVKQLLYNCLKSIAKDTSIKNAETIVVDNFSSDGSSTLKRKFPSVKFINLTENTGFAKANNIGASHARGECLIFLNPDTEVTPGSLIKLYDFYLNHKNVGALSPRLLNPDNSIQPSCFRFPSTIGAVKEFWLKQPGSFLKYYPDSSQPTKVDCSVGACVLIPKKIFEKIGGWDERYFMFFEDIEMGRQLKLSGLDFWYLPESTVKHIHGASSSQTSSLSSKRLAESSQVYHGKIKYYLITSIIKSSQIIFRRPRLFAVLAILLLLSIPSFSSLIRRGYFSMHDDMQVIRLYEMDNCVKDLQIPCRWVSNLGYGYGYPLFNFYPPFPYYLGEIFHLIGVDLFDTVKLLAILGFITSGTLMFILAREFWGDYGGLISAVLYIYAPYHAVDLYVRGAINEFWALVFLPGVLWAIYKIIQTNNSQYNFWLALFSSGLLLSHNVITMIASPFIVTWTIFHLISTKSLKSLPKLITSGIWGIGIAAFFFLPVIFEQKFAHVETLTIGYFNYLAHYVSLGQMFISRFWGYGGSFWGEDGMSFQIGYLNWGLPIISLALALVNFGSNKGKKLLILFLTLSFLAAAFMAHPRSLPIWQKIPPLEFVQFPWRFLTIVILMTSLAAGSITLWFKEKRQLLATVYVCVFAFGIYASYFHPEKWFNITEKEKFTGELWRLQITASIFDYLPIYAPMPPAGPPSADAVIIEQNNPDLESQIIPAIVKKSNLQKYEVVNSQNSNINLQINTFYFPGWKAYIDGKSTNIAYSNDPLARIHISVPAGKHKVDIRFKDTPIRIISNLISLISIILLLIKAPKSFKIS